MRAPYGVNPWEDCAVGSCGFLANPLLWLFFDVKVGSCVAILDGRISKARSYFSIRIESSCVTSIVLQSLGTHVLLGVLLTGVNRG